MWFLSLGFVFGCGAAPEQPARPAEAIARIEALPATEATTWFVPAVQLPTPEPGPGGLRKRTPNGGEAIAVFDIDVDGLLDVVIVNGTNRIYAFRNGTATEPASTWFLRETPIGPDDDGHIYNPKALGVHDWDHDGDLDLWVGTQGQGQAITYQAGRRANADRGVHRRAAFVSRNNLRDGRFPFVDVGLKGAGSQRSLLVADYDGDGREDALRVNSVYYGAWYAGGTEGNALQPGIAGGRFGPDLIDEVLSDRPHFWTNEAGESEKNFKGAIVRDLDQDGRPDVVLGAFADVWANFQTDVVRDGYGWQGPWERGVYLLHNQSTTGQIRFDEVGGAAFDVAAGPAPTPPVHGILAADIDGDADLDLILTGYKGRYGHGTEAHDTPLVRVMRNDSEPGTLRFTDVTAASGLGVFNDDATLPKPYPVRVRRAGVGLAVYPAMLEGIAADIDNDADVDLVMVDRQIARKTGGDDSLNLHPWVFLNDGTGRFRIVPQGRHGLRGTSRAVSFGDFDADGALDLVFSDGSGGGQQVSDGNYVYLNRGPSPAPSVSVEASTPSDPWAIGAVVTVRSPEGAVLGHDEIRTDVCYRSRRDASVHVGTADAEDVVVEVRFPDDTVVTCPPVPTGRRLRLALGKGEPRLYSRQRTAPRGSGKNFKLCARSSSP